MNCRKNVKNLTATEKNNFVQALLALKSTDSVLHPGAQSRYDDFVETHLLSMYDFSIGGARPESWAHGGAVFLPWHRELLYQFEKLLQNVSGNPDVMIPYWDWTREQNSGDAGFPFVHTFLGVDGDDGDLDQVKKEAGAPSPYPYAFDPENWASLINVADPGASLLFQRAFGEFDDIGTNNDAPDLPENDTVVTGTGTTYRQAISGSISYLTHNNRCEDLHNLVHRWVGGNMLAMTSPNDPVFFLHHASIDRMWNIWQEKVPAATPKYQQSSLTAGHKLNDPMNFHEAGDPAPFTIGATPAQMINSHALHGEGVWYDSDIPEITMPDPTLDFINIPEGLTSQKAVKFRIKGCREVRFRITGPPTGNFSLTTMGMDFIAKPVPEDDFFFGYVWVQLTAVAGTIANSVVNIEAYIIDQEGYYAAAEGGEYSLGTYSITLTATTVPRENNAIALVLDRSLSMGIMAGGTSTRSDLVKGAIETFRTLMLPNDEVAIVTFDDLVDTPVTMQTVNGAPAFNTVDLTPRGLTWIGGGIQAAVLQTAAATHTNTAMIVLTDGNENISPKIADLPAGTVTDRTYAIGFGLPGQVSDAALQQITSNTNGDLIITGNISTTEQRFHLTKYFVQVLAGIMSQNVILDPEGKLYFESKDVVPFQVSDSDVYLDVIALCPIPEFIRFELITPGGNTISPSSVSSNVQFLDGKEVQLYRMVLPALPNEPSHGGTWNAVLSLKSADEIKEIMSNKDIVKQVVRPRVEGYIPYSLIVNTTSNLNFNAWKVQEGVAPGTDVTLKATLQEYDVSLNYPVDMWVEVTGPDGANFDLTLNKNNLDQYEARFTSYASGLYRFRVRAEGYTSTGTPFTREKTLTAGFFYELPGDQGSGDRDGNEKLCRLIKCVLKDREVINDKVLKRWEKEGFNMKRVLECIEHMCRDKKAELVPGLQNLLEIAAKRRKDQVKGKVKIKQMPSVKNVKVVKRDAKREKRILEARETPKTTMFTRLDPEKLKETDERKK